MKQIVGCLMATRSAHWCEIISEEEFKILCTYRTSSYSCRGNYSFLNTSSEETIQGEETNQGRKLDEEIWYVILLT